MSTLNNLRALLTDFNSPTPEEGAEVAIAVYKAAKTGEAEAALPWQDLQRKAKTVAANILNEWHLTGITTPAGKVYLPADGVSVSYDAQALDRLCVADPALRDLLWPHRTEKARPGALTIR